MIAKYALYHLTIRLNSCCKWATPIVVREREGSATLPRPLGKGTGQLLVKEREGCATYLGPYLVRDWAAGEVHGW